MAIMLPKKPRTGTKSYAEKLLFDAFQKQLPDTFHVYHSVAWQIRDQKAGIQDGEADFVIVDPSGNMMVLEVKGGERIAYDSEKDEWTSNGNVIKDPFRQGVNATHSLIRKLNDILGIPIDFRIGNAVAFPEVTIPNIRGLDKGREIILDADDVERLHTWIGKYFSKVNAEYHSQHQTPESVRRKIEEILNPSWKFSQPLTQYFTSVNQIIDNLTEEQYRVINYLQHYRRFAISGCAGSGKTLVAIEKAIRLSKENFSVLILCHNPFLARDIRTKVKETNIEVWSFRDFLYKQIDRPKSEPIIGELLTSTVWTRFDEPSADELEMAFNKLANQEVLYDAVIVDEGQDFHDEWWAIVEAALTDPINGILYIFYDENQLVSPFSSLKFPVGKFPIDLSRNCRNAGKIYRWIQQLRPEIPEISEELLDKGITKEWVYSTDDDLISKLQDALLNAEKFSTKLKRIAVITAEMKTIDKSILDGLVFSSPSLQQLSDIAPIPWQKGIGEYLTGYGFNINLLSKEHFPVQKDKKLVQEFCSDWLSFHRTSIYGSTGNLSSTNKICWSMDRYGDIHLTLDGMFIAKSLTWEIMSFLSKANWTKSLPSNHKRYRLTRIGEASQYPTYYNVPLADIPSFKGLEADGVVFVLYEYSGCTDAQFITNLYIALSRAKNLLFMITPFSLENEIAKLKKRVYG
jgi:hypothetical protein